MTKKLIALSIFVIIGMAGYSQHVNQNKILIADETVLIETRKGAKIETHVEHFKDRIMFKFQGKVKWKWKWERWSGLVYKHYILYTDKETAYKIKEWAKNNL